MPQTRLDAIILPFATVAAGREATGDVFFVGSTVSGATDAAATHGSSPLTPFKTIAYAISQTTANNGDLIYVMASHVETVVSAGGLDLNQAGIHIVGLGQGATQAKIRFTTLTTADMNVSSANVIVESMLFDLTELDAMAAPIDVNAANFTLRKCRVLFSDSSAQATGVLIADTNSEGMTIEDCIFRGTTDAGTETVVDLSAAVENITIQRNRFEGEWNTACIRNAGGATITNLLVRDNVFLDFFGDYGILIGGSSTTGLARNNTFITPEPTLAISNSSSDGFADANNVAYDSDAGDNSGAIPVPVRGSILLGGTSILDIIIGNQAFYNRPSMREVTADLSSATWNTVAVHKIASVGAQGACRVRILPYCTALPTSGGSPTITLGLTGDLAALIGSTTLTGISAGDVWLSTSPTNYYDWTSVIDIVVSQSVDIGYEIGSAAATGGTLKFFIWYERLTAAAAAVTAGDGSAF